MANDKIQRNVIYEVTFVKFHISETPRFYRGVFVLFKTLIDKDFHNFKIHTKFNYNFAPIMKILIIEDNKELAQSMKFYLEGENYICECAYNYNEALERLTFNSYDCILLDIMLPDGNGLNILNYIKTEKINSGILIISAKNALDDKIDGLEKGADDYITKPFHLPELHARLRAVYRRNKMDGYNEVKFNEIILNTDTYEVSINEIRLEVTQKEFELLLYFLVNKNRVLSKQSIANHLWGDYTDNLANFDFVYQHVKNLRKKIAFAKGNDYIETIYGLGYKFNALKYSSS